MRVPLAVAGPVSQIARASEAKPSAVVLRETLMKLDECWIDDNASVLHVQQCSP